jgi:hypothetical protein
VAALFTDHSIGIFDLDSGEPFNEAFVNKAHASLPVRQLFILYYTRWSALNMLVVYDDIA